jgi:hypothetical protein
MRPAALATTVKAFKQNGWVIVESVFSPEEMEKLKKTAMACCDQELQGKTLCVVGDGAQDEVVEKGSSVHADKDASGKLLPRKLVCSAPSFLLHILSALETRPTAQSHSRQHVDTF